MTRSLAPLLIVAALAAGLTACGRRSALDVPQTLEQALPGTPQDGAARNPPRDAEGRPMEPGRLPAIRPMTDRFVLDPILR